MRDQHLQTIREACIKENPDILALKFGCELQRPNTPRTYMVIEDMTWGGNSKEVWINSVPFGSMKLPIRVSKADVLKGIPDDNGEVWNIIGRPIRFADVLLAIGERYAFDGTGALLERQFGTSAYDMAGMPGGWNLRDDLTQQSDECLAFLADLLA